MKNIIILAILLLFPAVSVGEQDSFNPNLHEFEKWKEIEKVWKSDHKWAYKNIKSNQTFAKRYYEIMMKHSLYHGLPESNPAYIDAYAVSYAAEMVDAYSELDVYQYIILMRDPEMKQKFEIANNIKSAFFLRYAMGKFPPSHGEPIAIPESYKNWKP